MGESQYCAELRDTDKDLKTKIQFNDKDLEVLTKRRRSEEQFSILALEEIEKSGPIPKFNHAIEWKQRTERLPRNPPK